MYRKLFAVLAAALALSAQSATARTMIATFTGTVTSTEGPLDGKSFTAVVRYDPDIGGMNYYVGGEDSYGGEGTHPTPALFESFRIEGEPDYDFAVAPNSYADISIYASSGNQFLGQQGFTTFQINHSEVDNPSGYYFFANLDLRGYVDTPNDLETPYSSVVQRGPYGNSFSSTLYVGNIQVRHVELGLNPTSLTVAAAPVPEPAEWATLGLGLAVAGGVARCRRRFA